MIFVFLISFCLSDGMRQKAGARTTLIDQFQKFRSLDAVTEDDLAKQVTQGAEQVQKVSCDEVENGLLDQLDNFEREFDLLCSEQNPSNPACVRCNCPIGMGSPDEICSKCDMWHPTLNGCRFSPECWPNMTRRETSGCDTTPKLKCPAGETDESGGCVYECHGRFDRLSAEQKDKLKSLSSSVVTTIMVMDEKRCLKSSLDHLLSKSGILSKRNAYWKQAQSYPGAHERVEQSFARLASWQESLASMGTTLVDRRLLFPDDIGNVFNCPRPCTSCTKKHNSLFKGSEADKFKCLLNKANRNTPPSNGEKRLSCEKPRRRMWKFWEYKTWCHVPGWVADAYLNARIAAMVTCGSSSILTSLRSDKTMSDEEMRICMLVQQRMAVTESELRTYQQAVATVDDGAVPVEFQHVFATFLALTTAQGLVGMRDTAEHSSRVPPSDDDWLQLFRDDNFTLVPPGLMKDVPCEPPVNNREIFLGAFAAVLAVGSAVLLSVLVTIPLLYISAIFFYLALITIIFVPQLGLVLGYIGGAILVSLPKIIKTTFTSTMSKVYNAVAPKRRQEKACPRGLLTLGSGSPVCIKSMDKLAASRYTCPGDASRSVVVSCEPVNNGVVVVRGEPCR